MYKIPPIFKKSLYFICFTLRKKLPVWYAAKYLNIYFFLRKIKKKYFNLFFLKET